MSNNHYYQYLGIIVFFLSFSFFFSACVLSNNKNQPDFVGQWVGTTVINSVPLNMEMDFNPNHSFSIKAFTGESQILDQSGTWSYSSRAVYLFTDSYKVGNPLVPQVVPTPTDSIPLSITGDTWPVTQIDPQSGDIYHVDFMRGG